MGCLVLCFWFFDIPNNLVGFFFCLVTRVLVHNMWHACLGSRTQAGVGEQVLRSKDWGADLENVMLGGRLLEALAGELLLEGSCRGAGIGKHVLGSSWWRAAVGSHLLMSRCWGANAGEQLLGSSCCLPVLGRSCW